MDGAGAGRWGVETRRAGSAVQRRTAPYSAVNIAYTARDNLDQIHPPPLSPPEALFADTLLAGPGHGRAAVPGPHRFRMSGITLDLAVWGGGST